MTLSFDIFTMTKQKINTNLIICYLPYAILFLVPFFYFLFFADHIFFSQEKSSLFIFSKDFLVENLHQPGSLLVYFAKFLTSFYRSEEHTSELESRQYL